MEGNLEEWAELLNLWPLVEREVELSLVSEHKKLASPAETQDIGAVRYGQGMIEGIRRVLAIPRRAVERLEKIKQ